MQQITSCGQKTVADLAQQHEFSSAAVSQLILAVAAGSGSMAEFDHREFGGPGMWMQGGMIMLSGRSNLTLKARVDALCLDISAHLATDSGLLEEVSGKRFEPVTAVSEQSQVSGATDFAMYASYGAWWPARLGVPTLSGQQNSLRYAWFAQAQRLALYDGQKLRLYDTGDHSLNGVSQQQTNDRSSMVFSSTRGSVAINDLVLLRQDNDASAEAAGGGGDRSFSHTPGPDSTPHTDIFDAIERLGELKTKGLLTEEEFAAKKSELLTRL